MPVTRLHRHSPQVHTNHIFHFAQGGFRCQKLFSTGTQNKYCNKDITNYLHKYQLKRSSTSTKSSASTSATYDKYILLPFRCSPTQPPLPHSPHAAPTQPPRSSNAGPTMPPRRRNAGPMPPPRSPQAASTPPQRRPHAAPTPPPPCLHATSTPPPRHLYTAVMQAPCRLQTAALSHNAASTRSTPLEPARRVCAPLYAWGPALSAAPRVGTGAEERLAAGNWGTGRVGWWGDGPGVWVGEVVGHVGGWRAGGDGPGGGLQAWGGGQAGGGGQGGGWRAGRGVARRMWGRFF